jgi:hypothetical protein
VNPIVKYSLARMVLFVGCLAAVAFVPNLNVFLKLLIALVVSSIGSFFLFRAWKDELADRLSTNSRRRLDEKERLRAALAGDDEPDSATRA